MGNKSRNEDEEGAMDDTERINRETLLRKNINLEGKTHFEISKLTGKYFGAHVPMDLGFPGALKHMEEIGGTALALFNKKQTFKEFVVPFPGIAKGSETYDERKQKFQEELEMQGSPHLKYFLPHAPFLVDIAKKKCERAKEMMLENVKVCEEFGFGNYLIHPGSFERKSHGKSDEESDQHLVDKAITRLARNIDDVMNQTSGVRIFVENKMRGGRCLGSVKDVIAIVNQVRDKSRIAVCLDTAHLYADGEDIRNPSVMENICLRLDRDLDPKIPRPAVGALHLNDNPGLLNNKRDVHESLGHGSIGRDLFEWIAKHPTLFREIPIILETPNKKIKWKSELSDLFSWAHKAYEN